MLYIKYFPFYDNLSYLSETSINNNSQSNKPIEKQNKQVRLSIIGRSANVRELRKYWGTNIYLFTNNCTTNKQ